MEVGLLTGPKSTLETVKVLHETILALRSALEGSRKEVIELKEQIQKGGRNKNATKSKSHKLRFVDLMEREENKETQTRLGSLHDENRLDSGAESDDIDDIELVFTMGEADAGSIHEDLVPIVEENYRKSVRSTVVAETDISKCGVIDESEVNLIARRNTLPNPSPYQPIIHREIMAAASRISGAGSPCRALLPNTQETGAQTDITALPGKWKSETYLAHKMSGNLTTLPSKFTLPVPQTKRLPLSDKTHEARRVLLSDINFTSMVPELSRSADHLHDEKHRTKVEPNYERKTQRDSRYCDIRQDSRSSCGSCFGSRCYPSSTSMAPVVYEGGSRRRHSWRPHQIFCCRSHHFWASVPSSPIRCRHEEEVDDGYCHSQSRKHKNRVHFRQCEPCRQSLPNLRLEGESGESTDSLVDEAEEFLRRSIDSMIITRTSMRRQETINSDTDSSMSFEPPNAAQPFLPKTVKDLKKNCFAKVIAPDGKIAVGRVKYSGHIPGKGEPYVGLELAGNSGFSDGSFMGHRFFTWLVDLKKAVLFINFVCSSSVISSADEKLVLSTKDFVQMVRRTVFYNIQEAPYSLYLIAATQAVPFSCHSEKSSSPGTYELDRANFDYSTIAALGGCS